MIEKYFRAGIRFHWIKPNDGTQALDGAVVDSAVQPTALTYKGLDPAILDPALLTTNVATLGFTMNMPIQYDWCDYAPGRTARKPIGPYDILTGYMSGCLITYWTERGVNHVGHIGTIDANPGNVNQTVKNTYRGAMGPTATGFNPAAQWTPGEIATLMSKFSTPPNPKVFALVTTHRQFYSILMFQVMLPVGEWICGGAKLVAPLSNAQLATALT